MKNKVLALLMICVLFTVSHSTAILGEEGGENPISEGSTPNLVTVDSIDLSLHMETAGEFSSLYSYENPFRGQDTSKGVTIEFKAVPTWEVAALGTIFAISGTGEHDGRLYFTPGSYLGYNSGNYGGFFDANMKDYMLVEDFIKEQATIKIEILPTGFSVSTNGNLAYDQTILDDATRASGDFKSDSDFTPVLNWLAHAETLNFGYGSWWNGVNADEAYIELSDVSFKLADGTVVFDEFVVDQNIIDEAAQVSESVSLKSKVNLTIPKYTGELTSVLKGTDHADYEGFSIIPIVIGVVAIVLITAGVIVLRVLKPQLFEMLAKAVPIKRYFKKSN